MMPTASASVKTSLVVILFLLITAGVVITACTPITPQPPITIPTATSSATPSLVFSPTPTLLRTVRSEYPTPQLTAALPIPPPLQGISQPEEVKSLLLIGTDSLSPFPGRSDAIILAFYHPRLGLASFLSIPPDTYLYIPGYTMQRLNTAYAVGGIEMVYDALQYNFGVRPDDYAISHLDDFVYFIDDVGGLEVTVVEKMPSICSDIAPGRNLLTGDQVMCYLRYRDKMNELNRNLRQQEVLRLVLQRMIHGGTMARLPDLFKLYQNSVETSLRTTEIIRSIPFMLRLGDANHVGYFQVKGAALKVWQLPEGLKPSVFLLNSGPAAIQVQDAINFVLEPEPNTELIITLEHELTISPTSTNTSTATLTPTATETGTPTVTSTSTTTATTTLTRTVTPTRTLTPSPSATVTLTNTP